jgi:hypothetical protein
MKRLQTYLCPGFDLNRWAEIEMRLGRTMEELRHGPETFHLVMDGKQIGQPTQLRNPWELRTHLEELHGDDPFTLLVVEDDLHSECVDAERVDGDPRY